ncbi:HET-domain-containing protein [Jackrogersella minutella]|nr:HET-domain-containing protein [Jackrogersella minutella]
MAPSYSHEKYCPLDNPSNEIRVLEIIENANEMVECRLVKGRVDDQPYGALSGCWDNQDCNDMEIIHIIESDQPHDFLVPKSLNSALRALRAHGVPRVWVDFVCMDQDTINGRYSRVSLMANILRGADCVYIWLGDEDDNSGLAINFIETQVSNLTEFYWLIEDDEIDKAWQALSAFMRRPVFSRRWIVQEIAVAQKATLLCGMDRVDWDIFADAVSLSNEEITIARKAHGNTNKKVPERMPEFVSESSAMKLVEEMNNIFRRPSGDKLQAQYSLEYLVSRFATFNSSEPRDAIYAFLAIARDTEPANELKRDEIKEWIGKEYIRQIFAKQLTAGNVSSLYHVDYKLPLSDVYVQFVEWVIHKSDKTRALDIICRPWAPEPSPLDEFCDYGEDEDGHWRIKTKLERSQEGEDTLPSWVPTLAKAAFGMDGEGQNIRRKNADNLVGLPIKCVYSAAGTRGITENFRIENGVTQCSQGPGLNGLHYHSMFVEGFILDKVKVLKHPSQQGNIPSDWIRMARRMDPNSDLPDEFWRTLIADRGPMGENVPRYYPRLIRHALNQGVRGDSLNTKEIIDSNNRVIGDVLRRVQSVIWNRRLMRTERERSLGLAPEATRPGDLICVLYGCSVPVVLRPITKTKKEVKEENQQQIEKQQEREWGSIAKIGQVWRDSVSLRRVAASRRQIQGLVDNMKSTSNATKKKIQQNWERNGPVGVLPKADKAPLKSDPYTYYQLIGECYVHGMMNGEALLRCEPSMLFEIR